MTLTIPQSIIASIKAHAANHPGEEVCGFWIPSTNEIIEAENLADEKSNFFEIDLDLQLATLDKHSDAVIYHTHFQDSQPAILSTLDILSSKVLRVPYLLVHTGFDEIDYYDSNNLNPYPLKGNSYLSSSYQFYLDHLYQWERWDCYSLFKNYYKGVLNITLADFPRLGDENAITSQDWNQFIDNFESQGFRKLEHDEPLQNHDVALMCLVGDRIHHAAIIVDASKPDSIQSIHSLGEDRLSKKFTFSDAYARKTRLVIRHQDIC